MWAMMPDLIVAIVIFSFFLLLAVAAPIWGVDSRDGFASNEYVRRAQWLGSHSGASPGFTPTQSHSGGTVRKAGASLHLASAALTTGTLAICAPGPEAAY
jgi:hypothetical protein